MSDRVDTRNANAEDEAIRWLVDFEDLGLDEHRRFGEWLDERPENRPAFEKLEREWRQLDVVQQLATDDPDPDVVDKWLRRRRWQRRGVPLGAAAGLAGIALVLAFWTPGRLAGNEGDLETVVGEFRQYVLPDESVVTLNTDSRAWVEYSNEARQVHLLRGEAHFDVAPLQDIPFLVTAGHATVRAVGTAFNVYLRGDAVEVTVTEGEVELIPTARTPAGSGPWPESQTLGEGEHFELGGARTSVSRVDQQELARQVAWQEGMLDFQAEALVDAVADAGRYTSTRITIDDAELYGLQVTGYIRAGDTETLLRLIESNEQVAIRRSGPEFVRIARKQ